MAASSAPTSRATEKPEMLATNPLATAAVRFVAEGVIAELVTAVAASAPPVALFNCHAPGAVTVGVIALIALKSQGNTALVVAYAIPVARMPFTAGGIAS